MASEIMEKIMKKSNSTIKYTKSILNDENKKDLVEICKELEIKHSSKTKPELIDAIINYKIL